MIIIKKNKNENFSKNFGFYTFKDSQDDDY